MADKEPCDVLKGTPAYDYCTRDSERLDGGSGGGGGGSDGLTDNAVTSVKELADSLIRHITAQLAPGKTWAPEKADSGIYAEFLWLGQHLTVAIFICVVVVCALTA